MILAGTVVVQNFRRTSPFGDQLVWSWLHPIASMKINVYVFRDHVNKESLRVDAMRKKLVDDMDLRGEYRRAHGLERYGDEGGFGGWSVKISGREPGRESPVIMNPPAAPRKNDWVEEQITEAEVEEAKRAEEAATAAAEAAATAAEAAKEAEAVLAAAAEKKKSSWW